MCLSLRVKLLMAIQFLLEECCVGVGGGGKYIMQQNLLGGEPLNYLSLGFLLQSGPE